MESLSPPPPHASKPPEGGSETRERLLDAAEDLFATHGFHAASVRDITQRAESNLAAVNYHFGSKSNLYRAVFERRLTELRTRRLEAIATSRAERSGLDGVLRAFAAAFLQPLVAADGGCRWIRLYSREILDPRLPHGLFFEQTIEPTQQALASALLEVCPGLESATALLCVQSLIGQLLHLRHLLDCGTVPGLSRSSDEAALTAMVDHVVRFSAAAIRHLEQRPVQ